MSKQAQPNILDALKQSLDEAEWSWLKPHAERQSIVIVSQDLNLIDVGEKVANNDSKQVQKWIASGRISKPTLPQMTAWDSTPSKRFLTLIVQPYVLIQEKAH